MTKIRPRGPQNEVRCGTAAIEFAFTLPLLVLITIGCVDLGRVAHASMTLANAVASGSDFAACYAFNSYTQSAGELGIRNEIINEMQTLSGFQLSELSILTEFEYDDPQQTVISIEARYPFQLGFHTFGLPNEITIHHRLQVVRYR